MRLEQTRVLLSNLVGLTLISERITGDPATEASHLIQLNQAISKLLGELGLSPSSAPQPDKPVNPLDFAKAFDKAAL